MEARPMRSFTVVALGILFTLSFAGEFNKKLSVGDPAPTWTDLPGTDGKKHSLSDLKDKSVIVVVFTCNSCPVAESYEDRIIDFAKKYAPNNKVAVIAVNVNTIEEDRLPKMQERAKDKGFPFLYLFDESQKIARDFGAMVTPEFFVIDKDRKIAYMGAMDEKGPPAAAGKSFLVDAVEAVLAGKKPPIGETLARGCRIRYDRKR
jgi:peroxiredoxin